VKLIKFRIQHYKSIKDSGYCSLADDLTILIGKNESGKTAILEALRDFDKKVYEIPPEAVPIDEYDVAPSLELCFRISRAELDVIQAESGISLPEEIIQFLLENGLTIVKDALGQYAVPIKILEHQLQKKSQERSSEPVNNIKAAREKLATLLAGHSLPELRFDGGINEISLSVKKIVVTVKSILPSLTDTVLQEHVVETLRFMIEKANDLQTESRDAKDVFMESVVKRLPHIAFLTKFEETLPFEILITELKDNQAVLDFAKLANLDLDKVMGTQDVQKRINLLNKYSAVVSAELFSHWQQNKVELVIKPEGDKILFGVKENEKTDFFKIQQRSKGFQWFLSFYLRLNTEKSPDTIIVIDEPGAHLHARAQKEILKVLETRIAPESQVIFSTHSSYLIDPARLDRVRVVMKNTQTGSLIANRIDPNFDEDSLTPVSTALGTDLSHNLPEFGKRNIITLSMADFYYIKAWKERSRKPKWAGIQLIPCVDQQQLFLLVSMMLGQDREFQIILNRDAKSLGLAENLKENFGLTDSGLIFTTDLLDSAMEDLFSYEDFNNIILGQEKNPDVTIANSRFVREKHLDRTVLAKRFYERAANKKDIGNFTDETLVAFDRFFEKVISGFTEALVPEQDQKTEQLIPATVEETNPEPKPDLPASLPEAKPRPSFFSFKKK
jgi:predicted ATP-dependent endonuclease of OLD family